MSEKEKRIVEKLKNAIPNMSDFDKHYKKQYLLLEAYFLSCL